VRQYIEARGGTSDHPSRVGGVPKSHFVARLPSSLTSLLPQKVYDDARFKLTIEYEGTRYSGWQIQKTPHGQVNRSAVGKALGTKEFELYGAGGPIPASTHCGRWLTSKPGMLAPEILRRKLNDELPWTSTSWKSPKLFRFPCPASRGVA